MKQHSCSESYYIEWREGSRRARLSVGKDAADASARRLRKEAELNALNNGVAILPSDGQNGHRSVAAAVAEFLDETRLSKKPKTLAAYRTALRYFVESCHKVNLEDIERRDLLKFSAFLRDEKGQSPRSCWNKFSNVMSFLKAQGIRGLVSGFKARALLSWPKFRAKSLSLALRDDFAGRFWRPDGGRCLDLTADGFVGFSRPGYAQVAWNFRLRPESPDCTVLSTETRVKCFGHVALWKFRAYWILVAPFSGLIRKAILRQVKTAAVKTAAESQAKGLS